MKTAAERQAKFEQFANQLVKGLDFKKDALGFYLSIDTILFYQFYLVGVCYGAS